MRPAVVTVFLLLVFFLDTVRAQSDICAATNPCGDGFFQIDDKRCAKYIKAKKTFTEAQNDCFRQNSKLLSIHNIDQMYEVFCLIYDGNTDLQTVWIGAKRSGGRFKYTDRTPFDFTLWYGPTPKAISVKEECVEINYKDWGMWNTANCSKENYYLCAKDV